MLSIENAAAILVGFYNFACNHALYNVCYGKRQSSCTCVCLQANYSLEQNPTQLPQLVALVVPHLPAQFASIIVNMFTYIGMVGLLLDDIAGLVLGVGIIVWASGLLAT